MEVASATAPPGEADDRHFLNLNTSDNYIESVPRENEDISWRSVANWRDSYLSLCSLPAEACKLNLPELLPPTEANGVNLVLGVHTSNRHILQLICPVT